MGQYEYRQTEETLRKHFLLNKTAEKRQSRDTQEKRNLAGIRKRKCYIKLRNCPINLQLLMLVTFLKNS